MKTFFLLMRIALILVAMQLGHAQSPLSCGSNVSLSWDNIGISSVQYLGVEYLDTTTPGWSRNTITFGANFADGVNPGNGGQTKTTGSNFTQIVFASNPTHSYTIRYDYSCLSTNDGVKVHVTLTNNSTASAINSFTSAVYVLSMSPPTPVVIVQAGVNPIAGGLGAYYTTPSTAVTCFGANFTDNWYFTNGGDSAANCSLVNSQSNGPINLSSPIPAAGGGTNTKILDMYVRFSSNTSTASSVVSAMQAEGLAAFLAVSPFNNSWPDHRPIATWFMANHGSKTSTNPRGYIFTTNALSPTGFASDLQSAANSTLGVMGGTFIKPQGIVFWDLVGQQFPQPASYFGWPSLLSTFSPEMDANADAMIAQFVSAGYRVGTTLRPNYFSTGSSLPSTCAYNSDQALAQYILCSSCTDSTVGATPNYLACQSNGTSWAGPAGDEQVPAFPFVQTGSGTGYAANDTFTVGGCGDGTGTGSVVTVSGGVPTAITTIFNSSYTQQAQCSTTATTGSGTGLLVNSTGFNSNQDLINNAANIIISNATYAHNRWGMTLFYVDSPVWDGGAFMLPAVWQQVKAACPWGLFMPETNGATYNWTNQESGAPYVDSGAAGIYSSLTHAYPYLNGFQGTSILNVSQANLAAGYATVSGNSLTTTVNSRGTGFTATTGAPTSGHAGASYTTASTGTVSGCGDGLGTFAVTNAPGGVVSSLTVSLDTSYATASGCPTTITSGPGDNTLQIDITAPWNGLTMNLNGQTVTIATVPSTTSLTLTTSSPGNANAPFSVNNGISNTIISGVQRGDIMLYRGWFSDATSAAASALYQLSGQAVYSGSSAGPNGAAGGNGSRK